MGICGQTKESVFKDSKFKDPNESNIDPNLKKGVCKIETPKKFGSGFFMKYKINEKYYYYLVSCEHVIETDLIKTKETIKIFYDNDKNNIELRLLEIKLDQNERYIKAFKDIMDLDITIIEIKSEDNIPENYFLFSELNKNYNENLINRRIYILQYPNWQKLQVSNGYIKRINKNEFFHFASTQNGSSGSPVFLLNETKVIGIHKQSNRSENIGDFIYQIFDVLKNDVDKIKGNYNINNSKKSNNEIKKIEPNKQIEQMNNYLPIEKCKEYNDDGKPTFEGEYLNGQKNGKCKEYDYYGKLIFEGVYLNDQKNGKCKEYDNNGKLKFEGEYLNGQKNGKCKEYYGNNGKLKFEGEYLNGQKNVKCKEYYGNNGKLILEGEYLNGQKNGKCKEYYENGKLKFEGE